MIDMGGKKITSDTFAGAQLFYSVMAVKKVTSGAHDRNGKTVIDFKFDKHPLPSGIAAVKQGDNEMHRQERKSYS